MADEASPGQGVGAGAERADLSALKPMVETIGAIATQLSLLGAVLIYFGTVSARVEARFFGLDPSELAYSNQELLVRSVAPLLGPLSVGGAIGVLLLQLNSLAGRHAGTLEDWSWTGRVVVVARVAGPTLLIVGAVWQWRLGSLHSYWSPLFLAAGAITLAGARGVAAMIRHRTRARRRQHGESGPGRDSPTIDDISPIRALDAQSKLMLGFVLVFAAFGFAARLAQADGFRRAATAVAALDEAPTVSVLSEEPLLMNRRGVTCLPVTGSHFTRRYLGLHLLFHREGRAYLVPSGYDVNNAVVIVLDDGPELRLEFDATPQLRRINGLPATPPLPAPNPALRC